MPKHKIQSILIVAYTEHRFKTIRAQIRKGKYSRRLNCIWVYNSYALHRRQPGYHYVFLDYSAKQIPSWLNLFELVIRKEWPIIDFAGEPGFRVNTDKKKPGD